VVGVGHEWRLAPALATDHDDHHDDAFDDHHDAFGWRRRRR
jgi:hypothetical protein